MPKFWTSWWSEDSIRIGVPDPYPFRVWNTGTRDARDPENPYLDEQSLCAVISAEDADAVREIIKIAWPDCEFRFINQVLDDFQPEPTRFPPHPKDAPDEPAESGVSVSGPRVEDNEDSELVQGVPECFGNHVPGQQACLICAAEAVCQTESRDGPAKRIDAGVRWSIAQPAWWCDSCVKAPGVGPHGYRCMNSHILTSGYPHPYPCSAETCPMLLEQPDLQQARYYREGWMWKGKPDGGA